MQQALGTQQIQHKHDIAQILSAFNAESMKLSEQLMKLNTMSRSVRAKEQSTQDADTKAQMKRQSEEIEDLKQQVKQSKKDMDQSIKLVQSQPISQSAPTAQGSDVKPVVEKILEEIREKRKQFLDATQAQQQIDQLKGEIQELKKFKISIKPKSPDKKEELPASSSSNNPPPPPDPPKVKPTKAPPKPSRRHRPATPEQAEAEAPAKVRSSSAETSFYPEPEVEAPRGRKRNNSKPKQETISELKEALAEVKKAQPKAKAKSEPKARSRTQISTIA
jgi:hypothetical protein